MKNRNAFLVMAGLIGMVKPLLGIMLLAILMGCIGNLMATFIMIMGGYALVSVCGTDMGISLTTIFTVLGICAVMRGVLRYTEQASNHYIAFKLLARIRHMVFAALRKLAPAKLDGSEKGNLISIITSDIELLEVFYAHTISPVMIGILTSVFMSVYLGSFHWSAGILAAVCYFSVGAVIPVVNSRKGQKAGREFRKKYGKLNTVVLDNLYGLEEIIQFQQKEQRLEKMSCDTQEIEEENKIMKELEGKQRIVTDSVILAAGVLMSVLSGYLVFIQKMDASKAVVCVIGMMSSFGPTAALSSLSNNLNQTLASGNRVLNLLEEEPATLDVIEGKEAEYGDIEVNSVDFSYDDREEKVLDQFSDIFCENAIHGILGKSGCGKSTLLKLLMRFYETDGGEILYHGTNVNEIKTVSLKKHIGYVTQETFLFQDTIENNIKVGREDASREEVVEVAKKAAIHDFIVSLPNGYDTKIKEKGFSLSGGEKQRIGIARAFLHNARVILLDEPTSNIDSLNEGIILKSLYEARKDKIIILVSHRKSTLGIADRISNV